MLISELCDYSKGFIAVNGTINLKTNGNKDMPQKDVLLKNNAPFFIMDN